MDQRLAIVTGSNRGIGLEVCKQLAQRGYLMMLTSRDPLEGTAVAAELRRAGMRIIYHQLDITNSTSIASLRQTVEQEYGTLAVLINNAAVADRGGNALTIKLDTVRQIMETNVLGALAMCQALIPLMQAGGYGRVVNVSSQMGQLKAMGSGWPGYRISKTALNALTRILAAEVRRQNILVNAACPGWVKTRMGGHGAPDSLEQGADTIVWLATLPDDGPTGGFFHNRQPIAW